MSINSKENIFRFIQNKGDIRLMDRMLNDQTITDINIMNNNESALMYQVQFGTVESMEFLLAHKPPALPNLQNIYGDTALHYVLIYTNDLAKLRLLLDYGADKTIRNRDGESALEYAKENNLVECIELLETYTPKSRVTSIKIGGGGGCGCGGGGGGGCGCEDEDEDEDEDEGDGQVENDTQTVSSIPLPLTIIQTLEEEVAREDKEKKCANCEKQITGWCHCCCNTGYCSEECQEIHFNIEHKNTCKPTHSYVNLLSFD